jgi:hypothetical protein
VNAAGKVALVLLCGGSVAAPQTPFRTISARAGSIGYQQGLVYVDDQRVHSVSGKPPFQMKNGQRLHIETGRVELLLGMGVYLRMLGASSIRMQETQLTDTRVLLEDGSAIIEVAGMNKGAQLRIVCGESITELKRDGLYRFDAANIPTNDEMPARLRIYSGDAAVERAGIVGKVRSGQAVDLAGLEPAKFDLKQLDALHSWSAQRIRRRIDNEQRRLQAGWMRAARIKVDLSERDPSTPSKQSQDQSSKGSQP